MRTSLWVAMVAAASLAACGGSTIQDGSGGAAGSGNASGSGGSGNVGGGGTGNTGNVGGGGTGNVGGGGMGGSGNVGGGGMGGAPFCCSNDGDCPTYFDGEDEPWPAQQCVNGVCKDVPPPGTCWSDKDCGSMPGSCLGGSVCPCGADCFAEDTLGKCGLGPGCCNTDADCPQSSTSATTCVSGNCEPVPPPGKCWSDKDCPFGSACGGSCICPCGSVCACGGQMGYCEGPPPPPPPTPYCCKTHAECGPSAVCAPGNVCKPKQPPYCWADIECPTGQKCAGAFACPCGAACGIADTPGKCQ